MSEPVYFLTIGLPLLTALLIFGMKYFAAIQQARANQQREEAVEQLAQSSSKALQETAEALRSIQAVQSRQEQRLAEIERILKQVE